MGPMITRQREAPVDAGRIDISVLGPLRVTRGGERLRLGGPKPQMVLALLIAAAGRPVSADALIDALWGEEPPVSARPTLQSHVSKLRAVLGGAVIWEGGAYRFDVHRDDVDALRFEDAISAARELMREEPSTASRRLAEALDLWRGPPFTGLPSCPSLDAEARRLEELRLQAVEDRVEAQLELGAHAELTAQLEVLTTENPLRERLVAQQMVALYRSGRQGDALRAYNRLRETLAEDLGIDPSGELRDLYERILHQAPELELAVARGTRDAGSLAFLFTDIEDSTPLWEVDPERMGEAVEQHDRIITTAVEASGGRIVARSGDAMDAVFTEVHQAVAGAVRAQVDLASVEPGGGPSLRVRMAIDVGDAELRDERYHGPVLNRLGRILGAAHGGQVLLSADAQEALGVRQGLETVPLGEYRFKGVGRPQEVHQLVAEGLDRDFPPLRLDRYPAPRGTPVVPLRGYELHEVIGEGDFGLVYRAYQPSVGREVAVKVIRAEYANQLAFVRRFEAEARLIAQLEHPHIVGLHDFWREPDAAYLVMPYLRGGCLAEALARGPWNVGPAVHLLDQVGAGLSYAHRNGVVHRDLKPANVLLDDDGNAYLSDFGIASRLTDEAGGVLTSSLSYIPPEELRGEELTPRSDIFSLGVLTLTLLTGEHPSGRDLPVIDDARPDLPVALGDVLRRATDDLPGGRYERVEDLLRALRQALDVDVGPLVVAERERASAVPVRNPYKGLRAFQDTDVGDFYGRETLVDELLQTISRNRLVAVIGSSGSGKSSVVRAGLLPALRAGALRGSRGWLVADMFPGSYPFEELESALLRVAVEDPGAVVEELRSDEHALLRVVKRILPPDDSELVLLIDQFEELFSLVDDEDTRRSFLNAIETLLSDQRSRVRVVLTLRADFFDRPLDYPRFGEMLKAGVVPVTPPSEESLGLAISRPARSTGVDLEPGLTGEIIADVVDQPGGLPLLQYTLTELFQRREGTQLTIAGYRATGGVVGALSRRAEELYDGLPREAREVARQLFLRLVTVDEEVDDARRRVSQSELDDLGVDPEHLRTVLQQYGAYRLLTFDRDTLTRVPTVEVAHEALIREWDRLRGWIDEQRRDLILHRRLQVSVRDWSEAGRDPSYLLRGDRLEQAERWAEGSGLVLSRVEQDFLAASRDLRDRDDAAARGRRRRAIASVAVAFAVVSTLAVLALVQRQIASDEARVATARELAAAAVANLEVDAERSILLTLEAIDHTRAVDGSVLPEAEEALHRAVTASRAVLNVPGVGGAVAWSPAGVFVTEGPEDTGVVDVRDAETGESILTFHGHDIDVNDVAFSHDGAMLATTGDDGAARVWDPATGEELAVLQGPPDAHVWGPSFSPDGTLFAAAWQTEGVVRVLDIATGDLVLELPLEWPFRTHFSPDGRELAISQHDAPGRGVIVDVLSGEELLTLEGHDWPVNDITWSPDGAWIATASHDLTARIWDAGTGEPRFTLHGHTGVVVDTDWTEDGGRLVTASADGTAKVWEISAEGTREVLTLSGQDMTSGVQGVAFSPEGDRVMGGDHDITAVQIWDVSEGGDAEWARIPVPEGSVTGVSFTPEGDLLAVGREGGVFTWDVTTGDGDRLISSRYAVSHIEVSPDGTLLATAHGEDPVRVWSLTTGEEVFAVDVEGWVERVAWSQDSAYLAVPSDAENVTILDRDGQDLSILHDPGFATFGATFTPDGQRLATASWRRDRPDLAASRVKIWDWRAGELIHEVVAAAEMVAFDSAGERLVTAEAGGSPQVWDLRDEESLTRLTGHTGGVTWIEFSPGDGRLATASFDGTVRLWDAATGRHQLLLRGHAGVVYQARFSPDGSKLATVSPDGTARVWALDLDDLIEIAHTKLTRGLTTEECRQYLHEEGCPAA